MSAELKNKTPITAFKGFDAQFACRGFQYEIGATYRHKGKVAACSAGFHSCTMPLDVFRYYPPGTSRYALVQAGGDISRREDGDSKVASAVLHVEVEMLLPDLVKRAVQWIIDAAAGNMATGDSGHAAATGDRGHAAATGQWGVAASLGPNGTATAGEAGAIVLSHWDTDYWPYKRTMTRAFEVGGPEGVKPGRRYRLKADGTPEEVA